MPPTSRNAAFQFLLIWMPCSKSCKADAETLSMRSCLGASKILSIRWPTRAAEISKDIYSVMTVITVKYDMTTMTILIFTITITVTITITITMRTLSTVIMPVSLNVQKPCSIQFQPNVGSFVQTKIRNLG